MGRKPTLIKTIPSSCAWRILSSTPAYLNLKQTIKVMKYLLKFAIFIMSFIIVCPILLWLEILYLMTFENKYMETVEIFCQKLKETFYSK